MKRPRHYVPMIRRDLVAALYAERVRRGIPMTKLVNEIIDQALGTHWQPGASGGGDTPQKQDSGEVFA